MMNTTRNIGNIALLTLWAIPAMAQELTLPAGAELTREVSQNTGAYSMPVAPWTAGSGLPTRQVEGAVSARSWKFEQSKLTPLQLSSPVRGQLLSAGFEIQLECATRECGGFDFRFSTFVLPAPDMYVNLRDYYFLSALHPDGSAVSVLASNDNTTGYLQIIRAGGARFQVSAPPAARDQDQAAAASPDDFAHRLEAMGHTVLSDLVFDTGSANLGDGAIKSLDDIAAYLKQNPTRRILFVGHTDAVGTLENNRALSQKRAESAMNYLKKNHNISSEQIGAEGAGFLSPVASNLTPEGREANRRVEAVLVSTK